MERVCIDKVLLDPVTMNEAVIESPPCSRSRGERAAHVVTMNAQFVEIAHQQEHFAALLRRADLSVADGLSLVWASRWLGQFVPERVAGADLMVRLMRNGGGDGQDRLLSRRQSWSGILRGKPIKPGVTSSYDSWSGLPTERLFGQSG